MKPQLFYGLHMTEGLAEYAEGRPKPERILLSDDLLGQMDQTFQGCPVFVNHRFDVDEENFAQDSDGYVVRSFFNEADGKHWAEFLVTSEDALRKIDQGWTLSNAYDVESWGVGGRWHGLDYDREVTGAGYNHLALVPDPRYEESIILKPEDFKKYNDEKLRLRDQRSNSGGLKVGFKFFKRERVENSADFETIDVVLPKCGKTMSLTKVINKADEAEVESVKTDKMANGDDMVECGGKKMKVNELVKAHEGALKKIKENSKRYDDEDEDGSDDEGEERREDAADDKEEQTERGEDSKDNADVGDEDHEVSESDDRPDMGSGEEREFQDEDDEDNKRENKHRHNRSRRHNDNRKHNYRGSRDQRHYDRLANAQDRADSKPLVIETSQDMMERGREMFGGSFPSRKERRGRA